MVTFDRYDSLFQYYGMIHSVDWLLLKAQAKQESRFDPAARSPVGAMGLTQFMPATFAEYSAKLGLKYPSAWNPEHAVMAQAAMMHDLLRRYKGDVRYALAAYNWGMGRVDREWRDPEPWEQDVTKMPKETQDYVNRITIYYDAYQLAAGGRSLVERSWVLPYA
jgi:soluble lytic murein transglycosylase